MKLAKLDEYLRNDENIRRIQKKYERYYLEAQQVREIAGMYAGREYITLSRKEHISDEIEAMVNWPGQISPYHVHNWIELAYVYSGTCRIIVKDKEILLKKGQFVLFDTDVPHLVGETGGDNILINFMLDKNCLSNHFFSQLSKDNSVTRFLVESLNKQVNHDKYMVFQTEENERIPDLVGYFLCEYFDGSICRDDILNSCMTWIFCELIHSYQRQENAQEGNLRDTRIAMILRYLENNYASCTLEKTAEFFGMSPNYLTSHIKKYTGYSFKQLVMQNRLKIAARLLRNTNLSVLAIANEVGYENIGFFNKKFTEMYQCKPGEYRKKESV